MADIGVPAIYGDIPPPDDVLRLRLEHDIQACKSRISRLAQDIEDLTKGKVKRLQAEKRMFELKLEHLQGDLNSISVNNSKGE